MLAAGVTSSTTVLAAVLGAGTGGIGAIGAAWYTTRRTKTGSVRSSEASELWDAMEGHLELLTKRADASDARVNDLYGRLEAANSLAEKLREERTKLSREVSRLTEANQHLKRLNEELQRRVTHLTDLLEHHEIDLGGTAP